MHAAGEWQGGFRTLLNDGRGHEVTVDLPLDEDGGNLGPSALELSVLSLAGCITTIFAIVAERRRLAFWSMRVELDAERPKGARTITRVSGTLRVGTAAAEEDVAAALAITLRTCPVGVTYHEAHIPVDVRLIQDPTPPIRPAAGPKGPRVLPR